MVVRDLEGLGIYDILLSLLWFFVGNIRLFFFFILD